jgi:CHAT domain-containing protein/Tfp pilus assembly protein PilF
MAVRYSKVLAGSIALLQLSILVVISPVLASDPVETFIVMADSIARASGDEALAAYVSENSILLGAAVGQLADVALDLEETGQHDAADENLDFAGRIAEIYQSQTGSSAPLDHIRTIRNWTDDEYAVWRQAKTLVDTATAARNSGEYDRAVTLLDEAMDLYDSIGDRRSIAVLWGSLGVVCWYEGDFEAVARNYENALAARRAIEDRILEGKTLNGLGSVNYQLGNLEIARDYYNKAINLRQDTGDLGGLATSLTYLGNVYLAIGRFVEARRALERALPVVESTGNMTKQYELLTSIASLNAEMGRMASSNSTYREALALAQEMDDPKCQIICHNNLALNFAEAYRYGEAMRELEAVKALLDQHPDAEQAIVYHRNSGITNLRIGELEWAQSDFDTLLEMADEYQMPAFELEALINLGYLARENGEFVDGLYHAEDAFDLAEEIGNPRMLRESLVLMAEIERDLGRYDDAVESWETLIGRDEAEGVEAKIATDRIGLANSHVLAGRSDVARAILKEAGPAIEATEDGDLILALASGIGHSFEKTNPDSACFYYEKTLALLDETRREIGATEVRTGYLGGSRRFYYEEVATYYAGLSGGDQGNKWAERAFVTIERAKARGLLDLVEAAVLASGSSAEDALLDSLYSLDPETPGYPERERRLKSLYARSRQDRLESLGGAHGRPEIVAGPDDIRRVLPEHTVLLAYALGDTSSLLWAVDAEGCEVYPLPERTDLRDVVAGLRDAIANPIIEDQTLRRTARRLHELLVEPAAGHIEKAEHLIIVPDGALFELPFEVLLTEEPASNTAWKDMPYLARTHSITYVPSASVYLALRGAKRDGDFERFLLAMGDPDYRMLKPLPGMWGRLAQLPHSRDEVLGIGSLLNDEKKAIYLGSDANEAVLKAKLRDERIRIVHLAAHGMVDPAEPTASCIALCPDKEGTENGYFQTLEVMSTQMDVGLIVLSACESARGRIGRGEGVVGLSRAFLASGTQGIVASLWAVSDESTAKLMKEFYRRMLEDKRPAGRALNDARFALMEDSRYAHPFHWSSFVVIGLERAPW